VNVEKKDRNIYTKELDPIDKYLVNIIKRFFQNDVETINNSAEAIIIEAVTRAKREIRLDGHYGVSSVNNKTGAVTLTAADVGAEPMIITKYSAFNKPFGNAADTVCEGNDPRLSDARTPLPHTHRATEIITDANHEFITQALIDKLNGIEANATNYHHPATHPATMIVEDSTHEFVTQADKDRWNDKAPKDVVTATNNGLMTPDMLDKLNSSFGSGGGMLDGDMTFEIPAPNTQSHGITWTGLTDFYKIFAEEYGGGEKTRLVFYGGDNMETDYFVYRFTQSAGSTYEPFEIHADKVISNADFYGKAEIYYKNQKLDDRFLGLHAKADDSAKLGGQLPSYYLDYNNLANRPAPYTPPVLPTGNDGQVFFVDGNTSSVTAPAYTLYKALLTTTDTDLTASKGIAIDFATVFNTWQRFSHSRSTEAQPASASDMNGWVYNSSTGQIVCQNNTGTYVGFVSTTAEKTDNYDLEVTLSSTDSDDDAIAVVAAFTTVSGREYTISAVRVMSFQSDDMAQGINAQWFLVYNYQRSDEKMLGHITVPGDTQGGWSLKPAGAKVKVVRTGDIIKVYTCAFGSTTIDTSTLLSVDLNSDPVLSKFKGPQQYGYGCYSQMYSTYSGINIVSGDIIYDMQHNQVLVKHNGVWNVDSSRTLDGDIGVGKFVFNDITQKLFYVSKDGVVLVSINPAEYVRKDEINKMIDDELRAKGLIS
jgi:hypothetical protein